MMELEVKAVKLGKEKFLSSTSFTQPGVFVSTGMGEGRMTLLGTGNVILLM